MSEVQKTMSLFQKIVRSNPPRCDVDPGCGAAIMCSDSVYRCPLHAAEDGFCGFCGIEAGGICADCAAINGVEQEDDVVQQIICNNCGEPIVWTGSIEDHSICPNCGGYIRE